MSEHGCTTGSSGDREYVPGSGTRNELVSSQNDGCTVQRVTINSFPFF